MNTLTQAHSNLRTAKAEYVRLQRQFGVNNPLTLAAAIHLFNARWMMRVARALGGVS